MTQEEILEVKILTVLEVLCYLGLSCMEKAPTDELVCKECFARGGGGWLGSGCIRMHPPSPWLAMGLKRDCRIRGTVWSLLFLKTLVQS